MAQGYQYAAALETQTAASWTPVPEERPAEIRPDVPAVPQGEIASLICSYAWDCGTALRVFTCESGLRANAISPDGQNIGIAQINLVHGYNVAYLLDPQRNLEYAYKLWLDQGWAPWACY